MSNYVESAAELVGKTHHYLSLMVILRRQELQMQIYLQSLNILIQPVQLKIELH